VFTITYQNLAAPSIITVQAGTNVTGLSETQIQVSTTGQATTTVTAYCTTNQSQSQRAIQIEASGTSMVGPILHDGGTYYQSAYEPPATPVHIYIDGQADNYAETLGGTSFGESYTLTWDPDVNPATFGYTIDPQTNAITSATIDTTDYENSSFEISGKANVTGNDKLGKVYITANTYSDVTRVVTFEFTLTQHSLTVTELNINGSTEKYLMLSGQMISF
jgi:hypothetical protein